MDKPKSISWQTIGEKMLAFNEQEKVKQKAIAQLEEMSKRQSPIDPGELVEIVSILKGDATGDEVT